MGKQSNIVSGERAGETLFAAVDPNARYVTPMPCALKFAAMLAPYPSVDAARNALQAAGAVLAKEGGR